MTIMFEPAEVVRKIHESAPALERRRGKALEAISPRAVSAARKTFALGMTDGERPLLQFDTSFLQTGSQGFLVTDQAIYSSVLRAPIPLANCEFVEGVKGKQGGIKVNGQVVCRYELAIEWHMRCLRQLGEHARQCGVGWPISDERVHMLRQMADDKYVSEAVRGAMEGFSPDEIQHALEATGMAKPAAGEVASLFPRFIRHSPWSRLPRFAVATVVLFGVIIFMANRQELPTDGIWPTLIGWSVVACLGYFWYNAGALLCRALVEAGPEKAAKRWREYCEWQLPEAERTRVRTPRTGLAPESVPRRVWPSTMEKYAPARLRIGLMASLVGLLAAVVLWAWPGVAMGTRIAVTVASLLSLTISSLWAMGTYKLLRSGRAIQAMVIEKGAPKKFNVSHLCLIRYRYEIEDVEHHGEHTFDGDPGLEAEDAVWVLVHPTQPSKSLLCSTG